MDSPLILEFPSYEIAQAYLEAINTLAATYWQGKGYTVINVNGETQLVGKSAATGADVPDACKTTTWDEVKESPDNTFYFISLSNDPRFPNWKQAMSDAGMLITYTEKQMPAEWL